MQFGTITGNAYRCAQVTFSFLCLQPGQIPDFLRALDSARILRIRNFLILLGPNHSYIESLDDLCNDGLPYYAGADIDIVAIPPQ